MFPDSYVPVCSKIPTSLKFCLARFASKIAAVSQFVSTKQRGPKIKIVWDKATINPYPPPEGFLGNVTVFFFNRIVGNPSSLSTIK
jgi:hypothetical protein